MALVGMKKHESASLRCNKDYADMALVGMRKHESALLKCNNDYAYGSERSDGVTIEVNLHDYYEILDVSSAKDKPVI